MGSTHSHAASDGAGKPLTAREQVKLYRDALLLSKSGAKPARVLKIAERALRHVEAEDREDGNLGVAPSQPRPAAEATECAVCMEEFGDGAARQPFRLQAGCGHGILCRRCTQEYCAQKVKDRECFPWLTCPVAECKQRIAPRDLVRLIDDTDGAEVSLPIRFIVARPQDGGVPEWVLARRSPARLVFLLTAKADGSSVVKSVAEPTPKAKENRSRSVIQRLIADQAIRPCPKCGRQSMKDRGVCNVIQCMKCSRIELADARDGTKLRGTQSEKSEGRHPVGAWRTILQPKPGGFRQVGVPSAPQGERNKIRPELQAWQ